MTIFSSFLELARRKLECLEYQYDTHKIQTGKDVSKLSDKERFEKNRRRRLMKEQQARQKEEQSRSQQLPAICSLCKEDLIPPLKVYICQEGHFHRERIGIKQNKKVKFD